MIISKSCHSVIAIKEPKKQVTAFDIEYFFIPSLIYLHILGMNHLIYHILMDFKFNSLELLDVKDRYMDLTKTMLHEEK